MKRRLVGSVPRLLLHAAPLKRMRALEDALDSFTRQRFDLRPSGSEFAHERTEDPRRNLGGAATVEALRESLVLEVGWGFKRQVYVANEVGAEVVGVDR